MGPTQSPQSVVEVEEGEIVENKQRRAARREKRKKPGAKKRARGAFETRARTVCASGGCANTLLVRGAPAALGTREFCGHAERAGARGALRVRTALLQGRRAFWLVYATRAMAAHAFDRLYGATWSLRCGLRFVVRPLLHDDSEDAEARKRRRRTLALGAQRSDGDLLRHAGVVRPKARPASAALLQLLKRDPQNCMFLKLPPQ